MNVYLAGKMDRKLGGWRDQIVGFQYCHLPLFKGSVPRWVRLRGDEKDPDLWDYPSHQATIQPWRPLPRAVLRTHDYVGPFRTEYTYAHDSEHSGEWHGSLGRGQHGMMDDQDRESIIAYSRRAIREADLVFAYINSPDAFGTCAEIGYAVALGKFTWVVTHVTAPFDWDDFWFVGDLAAGHDQVSHEGSSESDCVLSCLKDAFVARSAWEPPVVSVSQVQQPDRTVREVAESFSQIARWSSDPRVRNEADRMFRMLVGRNEF